jgi:phosphonopyruvate decarboxylase
MIEAADFLEPARARGFDFWAGVPCSYLKPFINYVIDDPGLVYVSAANEGDAVAAATGAALAGRRGVAIMQNSGLGNAVSPLSSLNWVFRIPVLLIVTLRGDPDHADEPQHELMGQITTPQLELLDIPWQWFPDSANAVDAALDAASAHMDGSGRPYALVMKKGTVAPYALRTPVPLRSRAWAEPGPVLISEMPSRNEVLRDLVSATPETGSVLVATTGYTGRELYAIADRPNQLYVVGSMGCASSLALGLSLCRPDLKVVVADGDGAALMRLGNLATIGACGRDNFRHVLLDNGMHESTGGQSTTSHAARFAAMAAAAGYRSAGEAATAADVGRAVSSKSGPAFIHVRTAPGVPDGLPRPKVTPVEVRARLMQQIGVEAAWLAGSA